MRARPVAQVNVAVKTLLMMDLEDNELGSQYALSSSGIPGP